MTAALAGLRLLVTRDPSSAARWIAELESRGVAAVARGVLAFEPLAKREAVLSAIRNLGDQGWIVFASANGARFFAEACHRAGARRPRGSRVAAIGAATADAADQAGWPADFVAARSDGTGFGEELAERIGPGGQALVVRPEVGRPELAAALRGAGVGVVELAVYRTVPAPDVTHVAQEIRDGTYDAILFTAPSTFDFLIACEATVPGLRDRIGALIRVAIGPTTGAAMDRAGLAPAAVAARPDAASIAGAVAAAAGL